MTHMLTMKQQFFIQVQVCGMKSKMHIGGSVEEMNTNMRILAFNMLKNINWDNIDCDILYT